jgi:hypothetical protein
MPGGAILFTTKVIATTYNFSVQVPVSPVSFAVAVITPRVVSRALSSCRVGVAVAVVAPHSVLRLLSSRRVWRRERCCRAAWCRGCGHCAACGLPLPSLRRVWCCGRGRCAVWVSRVPALCRVWCCGCCCRAVWRRGRCCRAAWCRGRGRGRCAACGSRSPSLRRVWCRGRGRCAACGSRSLSLRRVWCRGHGRCAACGSWSRSSWWLSLCRVVPQPRSSSSRCHWTTKEEVSRKMKKENIPAGRRSACSREGTNVWATSTVHIPQNYLITFYLFMRFWYMNVLKDRLERLTAYKFHDR